MTKCCGSSKYNARMLRESVVFERSARVSDGAGGYTRSWGAISGAPTRAMVKPLSGRERWASDRTEAGTNFRVVVRYFADLKPSDRVVIRGRSADIQFIGNVDLMDEWLEIDVNLGEAV